MERGQWVKLSDDETEIVVLALEMYGMRSTSPLISPLLERLR